MAEQKPAAKTKAAAPTEAVKNCAGCNKPIKKAKRYYRNGKYYCNKKCWKTSQKTEAKASGDAPEKKEDKKE